MASENSRRIPIENAASIDEINAAIESLTSAQLKRLERNARWRVKGLGRKKAGRNWEELLQETVTSFCSGTRRWNKEKIDFMRAMTEAIRSISNNWGRTFDEDEPFLETELVTTSSEGVESKPFSNVVAANWNVQKEMETKKELEIIENLLSKRELAALIIMGWKDKMTGTEIQIDLEISKTQYETEVTWIRRTVRAAYKEQGNA
jgi:hypothetical protein